MKTWRLFQLIIACVFLSAATANAENGLVRISDHVYSYVDIQEASPANSFGANAGIVVGDREIAVIDSLISAKQATKFLADIRKISDKPIRYVIDTHNHLDHTFGNGVFAGQGAIIVAQEKCAEAMQSNMAEALANAAAYGLTPEEMAGTTLSYPTRTFSEKMQIDLGGITVDLLFVCPSHSPGSIMVQVPAEKVVFAGDILFSDFYPYMGEGDIAGWLKNLEAMENLGAERIIPGHGPLSTISDVKAMAAYLTLFDTEARELVNAGTPLETAVAELKKKLPARAQGEWLIRASLQAKYMPKE
jgi:cyclase